jgi:hypothetical protein
MVALNDRFQIGFERTLRLPDHGGPYPLPPGLGPLPMRRVLEYDDKVPAGWRAGAGPEDIFLLLHDHEALFIVFVGAEWKPSAVKVGVGGRNAVSGEPWDEVLHDDPQDYLVCPPQPWLDGINAGEGTIRQFVAMPLGMGYTVEAQVTGEETFGGIQIIVYEPKPGNFPDQPPERDVAYRVSDGMVYAAAPAMARAVGGAEMGLAAGGKMKQKIYPDPHGIDTWDPENHGRIYVHIVNSLMYRELTGKEPPATPVTAKTYAQYGLPWFDLYDDKLEDISAPDALKNVKSVKEKDQEKGFTSQQDDEPVEIPEDKVIKYKMDPDEGVKDGDW